MEHTIIIAGSGGQGTLFLGRLMAYSTMLEGKEVTWMPSYGAEMRGGTANCTVIISDEMIGSPVVRNPRILVAMNSASCKRFAGKILPGGMLLYDSSLIDLADLTPPISSLKAIREAVDMGNNIEVLGVPASMLSATMNNTKLANMVMMGAFISSTGILSLASVVRALNDMTPTSRKNMIDINRQLIEKGLDIIEHKKGDHN